MTKPGQGCGCALCTHPWPDTPPLNMREAAARREAYEAHRRSYREDHPVRTKEEIARDE